MSQLNRFAGVAMAALMSGCAAVGPNFKAPAAPSVTGYAMAGDPAPTALQLTPDARTGGAWWLALGSPQLDATVRRALADSPSVAEAAATLQKARAEAAAARGAELPQASVNAGLERERVNIQSFGISAFPNPTINLYSIGGAVSYDLDLFGGQKRRVEAADARAEAQARRADAAYLSLSGNVALQALRIAMLRAQIATVQQVADDDRRVIAMVRSAEQAGGQAPSAITGGQAQLAEDEAMLPPLVRALNMARHQLALLSGRSPAEYTAPDFDLTSFTLPANVPVSLPSELVRRRPDIAEAEADLHAATADVGVAVADQYPDIRLSAGFEQGSLHPGDLFKYSSTAWNFGAGLTAPIFDGGQLRFRRKAAEAEARISMARYQQTVLRAFVQVSDVLAALATDEQAIAVLSRSQATATSRVNDAQSALRLGGGSLLEVVDAQRQLSRARRALVEAEGQRFSDLVELFTATAGNWRAS